MCFLIITRSTSLTLLKNYNNIINDYLNEALIELVNDDDNHNPTYRPVVKEERDTTKVRIVYQASAKIPG